VIDRRLVARTGAGSPAVRADSQLIFRPPTSALPDPIARRACAARSYDLHHDGQRLRAKKARSCPRRAQPCGGSTSRSSNDAQDRHTPASATRSVLCSHGRRIA